MPINFKGIPFSSPVRPKNATQTVQQRQTQEVVQQEVQIQFELENLEENFSQHSRVEQLKLNLFPEEEGSIDRLGSALDELDKLLALEQKYDVLAKKSFAVAGVILTQVVRSQVNRIGIRTGNTIKQERLQPALSFASQLSGVVLGFALNPLVGITAAVGFTVNAAIKEQQIVFQRTRETQDNQARLQLVGGISQRGNR